MPFIHIKSRPLSNRRRVGKRIMNLSLIAALASFLLISFTPSAMAGEGGQVENLTAEFQDFLPTYIQAIKQRDAEFLATVHPELPKEMTDFFFGLTLDMMRHAEAGGLKPSLTCKAYGVCKVTWPQPGNHWAAQSFIKHEGRWRWLSE